MPIPTPIFSEIGRRISSDCRLRGGSLLTSVLPRLFLSASKPIYILCQSRAGNGLRRDVALQCERERGEPPHLRLNVGEGQRSRWLRGLALYCLRPPAIDVRGISFQINSGAAEASMPQRLLHHWETRARVQQVVAYLIVKL